MDPYWAEWLHLIVRWTHFTVGVAWIGASFYFNWLNNSVRPPEEDEEGVIGEVWAIHGGAYYRVTKHDRNMPRLPTSLHWFKYEAYFTWITGFILLGLVYHMNAKAYLIKPGSDMSVGMASMLSTGSLVVAWVVYDLLCKSPLKKRPVAFALIGFALVTAAAYGLHQIFSARAAYIHVGAMIGTCMAANVFFVIIPGQRAMVEATEKGEEPDVSKGEAGSFRSLHQLPDPARALPDLGALPHDLRTRRKLGDPRRAGAAERRRPALVQPARSGSPQRLDSPRLCGRWHRACFCRQTPTRHPAARRGVSGSPLRSRQCGFVRRSSGDLSASLQHVPCGQAHARHRTRCAQRGDVRYARADRRQSG